MLTSVNPELLKYVTPQNYTLTPLAVLNGWHNLPEQILMSQYSHRLPLSSV